MKSTFARAVATLICGALLVAPATPAVAGGLAAPANAIAGFSPLSVTFVSLRTGWALGTEPCSSGRCLTVVQTRNAGRSWSPLPLPLSLVAQADRKVNGYEADASLPPSIGVRFANLRDGWIFGGLPGRNGYLSPLLWSTHDGGRSWLEQHLSPALVSSEGYVFDLEAANGIAWMLVPNPHASATVMASSVGTDHWRAVPAPPLPFPAGGAEPTGTIVLQGRAGWLVEGNDRGVTGSARLTSSGRWVAWSPPCAGVGDSYTVPSASNAQDLVAVCVMGGFASPMPKHPPRGATLGSSWLYSSSDGGRTFGATAEVAPRGEGYSGVLASPRPGVALVGRSNSSGQLELAASFDNGHHWTAVYQGNFFYLGFTSPSQGVGLVEEATAGRSIMVTSSNGGRTWAVAHF